jgi:hypothetical protein
VVSGVNDTADHWWAVSMTPLTTGGGVNNTADKWWAVSMTPLTTVTDPYNFDWIQINTPKNLVPDPTAI